MLKGNYNALYLAILLHVLLFWLINSVEITAPKQKKIAAKAIKSFIYTPIIPKKIITPPSTVESDTIPIIDPEPKINPEPQPKLEPEPEMIKKMVLSDTENTPKTEKPTINDQLELKDKTKLPSSNKPKLSPREQLSQLQQRINQQMMQEEFDAFRQHRSPSVMHGTPIPVPHSQNKLTADQQHKQNTTQLSSDIAITKNDNGTCTIKQDLTNVGMEGLSASQMFFCGESAFDKSFRLHMEKVQKKLGK